MGRRARRSRGSLLVFGLILIGVIIGLLALLRQGMIPDHWHPLRPLDINAPLTPVTKIQLRRVISSKQACIKTLGDAGVDIREMEDFVAEENARCGIENNVMLTGLGTTGINRLQTRCDMALRLVLWARHDIEPAAKEHLGQSIASIRHMGSYNCRPINGSRGQGRRLSKHATARAIDIAGVTLEDGTRISIKKHWGEGSEGNFLAAIHQGACQWFQGVLGPDYNANHHDHFHLEFGDWPHCR